LSKLFVRIKLEGELARIFESIREANKLKTESKPKQTLIDEDIRCFGNVVEVPMSKEFYQQIWRLIRDFDLNYSSVEEFVQETFIEMLKLAWKTLNQVEAETLQEKLLPYIM